MSYIHICLNVCSYAVAFVVSLLYLVCTHVDSVRLVSCMSPRSRTLFLFLLFTNVIIYNMLVHLQQLCCIHTFMRVGLSSCRQVSLFKKYEFGILMHKHLTIYSCLQLIYFISFLYGNNLVFLYANILIHTNYKDNMLPFLYVKK